MTDVLTFAGFAYPRKIARWTGASIDRRLGTSGAPVEGSARRPYGARRLWDRKKSPWCFAYRQNRPAMAGTGLSGYLGETGWPHMRWTWADECEGVRIDHTGWFTDEDGCGETMRGIVLRLPHGHGFLAGQSMGEGMSTDFESKVYDDERKAARAADRYAELTAENEREYQKAFQAGQQAGEARASLLAEASESLDAARRLRTGARAALVRALAARSGEAMGFLPPGAADEGRRLYVECLTRARDHLADCCSVRRQAWQDWRRARSEVSRDCRESFEDGASCA